MAVFRRYRGDPFPETGVDAGANSAPEVFDHAPSSGAEQRLLTLAKAMKKVEHRIVPLRSVGVIVGRQLHAVMNGLFEDTALNYIAVRPALRAGRQR